MTARGADDLSPAALAAIKAEDSKHSEKPDNFRRLIRGLFAAARDAFA